MAWQTLDDLKKIRQIITYLITERIEIQIRFQGEEAVFRSKFIKIDQPDILSEIGQSRLIVEKLQPEDGNALIQSAPEMDVQFIIKGSSCNCTLKFIEVSNNYPHFGYILNFPSTLGIEEKRKEERVTHEKPELYSVEFIIEENTPNETKCKFDVFDSSKHGLCMIIPPGDVDIMQKLDIGDQINDITFYGSWTVIRVDGTVRHKTRIGDGKYEGGFLLGIESSEIIENINSQ